MAPESRIDRMEADGILTAGQAEMLRRSLAAGRGGDGAGGAEAAGAPRGARRRGRAWWIAIGALAALVAALWLVPGSGVDPNAIQDVSQTLNQPGGHGEMNKSVSAALAIAILLLVPLVTWVILHNSLVAKEERVFEAWAQTESNFQRRADLIPALVDTVSRYLRHEAETQTAVARERGAAADRLGDAVDALIKAEKESAEILRDRGEGLIERDADLARLFQAQARVGQSMGALMAVVEAYPDLRSSDQFLELQAQLEGTENRINVARMRFNDAVRSYNRSIRQLPWTLVASAGGFQRKAYFQAESEARDAPELDFDRAETK